MNDLSVADLVVTDETMLDRYDRVAAAHHAAAAIHYFGRTITWAELDRIGDEIAAGLRTRGIVGGDRVALLMQNVPQYMLTLVGVWKAGATAVPINPMLTPREVRFILDDAGAAALIGLDDLLAAALDPDHGPLPALTVLVSTRRDEYAAEWPDRFEGGSDQPVAGAVEWVDLLAGGERIDHAAATPLGRADDAAVITYTSGTTGPPKGAVNTHRNVLFACRFYEHWMALDQRDVILGIAPLFHITGLVGHIGPCLVTGAALVLGYRFDVDVLAELAERHRATFTIGAITAFIAVMNHPATARHDLSSLVKVYSGGAPIAPTTVADFEDRIGPYIHNIYGLTEATGPCLAVPLGERSPVDPVSGALAAGVPVCNTEIRLVRDDGTEAAVGEPAELAMRGPQVVPGYWHREGETAHAIRDGWLFTGDVAVRDEAGWYYIVDRIKDQINASGYKVWPREVEDALVAHPAVSEAAVVGVPDEYRGETVKAFVVLVSGAEATPEDLIEFCRSRLAAYKYPRLLDVVDELPRNASGKILRRALRDASS